MPKAKREKLVGDEANFRQLLITYKRSARKRGHAFQITAARFRELTKSPCYICGKEPSREYRHSHRRKAYSTPYICNGVDRFDNSEGYIEGNVIACCGDCNIAKGKLSVEQFLLHVYDIYNHAIKPAIEEGVPNEHDHEENK